MATKKRPRTKARIRIAFIGAGHMARKVHYPSLASFEDVELVAICDLNEERLHATADQYEVQGRYTDYRRMLELVAPDGVYVIGHPQYMYEIWVWCLQQGQNLYIEKPMGLTLHQAEILAHLAQEQGVVTQVSHQRRSCPLLVKLREQCLQRGPIYHAVCEFFKCNQKPALMAAGHMMDDCTHSIDTVRWMCGGEVVGVESECKRLGTPDINWIGATLHFDNGATGYLVNTWASGRRVFRVQMHAPGIYTDAEVENQAWLYTDGDYEGVAYDTKQVAGSDELYVYGGFRAKNREFIDSLKTGVPMTSSPFSDTLKTMRIAEQILAQSVLQPAACEAASAERERLVAYA